MKKKRRLGAIVGIIVLMFNVIFTSLPMSVVAEEETQPTAVTDTQKVKIRFYKEDVDYAGWNIWSWWPNQDGKEIDFTHSDEQGVYAVVDVPKTGELGLIIRKGDWELKATSDVTYDLANGEKEIVITAGKIDKDNPTDFKVEEVDLRKDFDTLTMNVHYNRTNADYDTWNIYSWLVNGQDGQETGYFTEKDDFGAIAKVEYANFKKATKVGFKVKKGDGWDSVDVDQERFIDTAYADCNGTIQLFLKQGVEPLFYTEKDANDYTQEQPEPTPPPTGRNPVLVGSLQTELGESADWKPDSTKTIMTELTDGFYTLTATLPKGEYEYKVAFGSWDENYGEDGNPGGDNIKLHLAEETKVTFYYSDVTHFIKDSTTYTPVFAIEKQPRLAGTIQTAMGESADWNPEKSTLLLADHTFTGVYTIDLQDVPKGTYEFKVTIGGAWDESYGDNGNNIVMNVPEKGDATITFDGKSKVVDVTVHVVTDSEFDGLVNKKKLYHNTWENLYKQPFGAVKEGEKVTLRFQSQKGDLQYARALVRNTKTNRSDLYAMNKVATIDLGNNEFADIWETTFTVGEPGVYGYKFVAVDGNTSAEYGEAGTEGKDGAAVDNNAPFFQMTVYAQDYTTPNWMKESVVYQIFPDRFFDGDKSNNTAKAYARGFEEIEFHNGWNELPDNPRLGEKGMNDITGPYTGDGIWSNDFFGGDIKGIQDKLDYLQGLGVTTLYLNPISMAASNHKYDAADYKQLDSMFGTEADFKNFTKELKKRNMHLIVDGVFNHVGDDSIYFDRYKKYDTVGAYEYWEYVYDTMNAQGITEDAARKKADKYFVDKGQTFSKEQWHLWFNIKNSKVNVGTINERYDYQCWWGFDSLPEFKSMSKDEAISLGLATEKDRFVNKSSEWNNKSFVDYIFMDDDSVAKHWIDLGADGWRLDVANEVETTFWNEFRIEMKKHNSETLILGEIWDDASKYFIGDEYDSVMNYRIRAALIDYLKNGNAVRLDEALMAIYEDYPKEAFYALMNLMGSHDTARAIHILGNGSDQVERAEMDENVDLELGKQRLKLASLFEFGYPGAPTVYYADEAGVTGSKDPDDRRTYPWGNEDNDLIAHYEQIGQIRNEHKDLFSHGDLTTLYTNKDSGVYVYGRMYKDQLGLVATNPTNKAATVTFKVNEIAANGVQFVDQMDKGYTVTVAKGEVTLTIPAMTGRILTSQNVVKLPTAVTEVTGEVGDKEASISWEAVDGVAGYKVYVSNFNGSLQTELTTTTDTSFKATNLTNGTTYYFAVSTIDNNGNESPLTWSKGVVPFSPITWTGNVTTLEDGVVDNTTSLTVKSEVYIENVSNQAGVSEGLFGRLAVKYPGDSHWTYTKAQYVGEVGNNDGFVATFIPTKPGKYEYQFEFTSKGVNGFNDEGDVTIADGKSFTFSLTQGDEESPADSIKVTQPEQQSGKVVLNWSVAGTNNITLFEVVRDGNVIARIQDGKATTYTDLDVNNKVAYTYQVIGYTKGGNSKTSNEVTITPDLVMVEVTFKLKAPGYTPLDEKVTIPGAMNGWDVNAWEMSRNGAVTTDWTYTTYILEGETVEYKYVKGGSWDQEALMRYSNDVAARQSEYGCSTGEGGNEKVIVENQGDGKMVIENEVIRWKDMPVVILDPANNSTTKNDSITIKGNAMKDPDLKINDEQVVVKEDGTFEHTVKLNVGNNPINVQIQPTEANKQDPTLFNNNAETIGFATKEITLNITRLDGSGGADSDSDVVAAQAVIDMIAALPAKITLADKAKVEEVRGAYNALTEAQQKLVTNYKTLTDAEEAITALENPNTGDSDAIAAQAVIDMIAALPAKITLADKAKVEEARGAYNALTEAQQKLVTNYKTLTDAEETIAALENPNGGGTTPPTGGEGTTPPADGETPENPDDNKSDGDNPSTGDTSLLGLSIILFIVAGSSLYIVRRRIQE